MTLKAVFFDMGGTIETYEWTPELRLERTTGLQERLMEYGIHLGLTDRKLYEVISAGLAVYHRESLQTMEELPPRRVWNEYILTDYHMGSKINDAVAEDLMLYIEDQYYQRAMRPEMPQVLETIRGMGLKIGLISNVNSRGLVPANLEAYGIRMYFDPLVLSSVYGRRKPDPAIFHHATRLAGVPTSACVYVGDRIARDILGAKRAGFLAVVQIEHTIDHREDDEGARPDAIIKDMTELVDILKKGMEKFPTPQHVSNHNRSGLCALLFDAGDILYFRPERGRRLQDFLKETRHADRELQEADFRALRKRAFLGSISQDKYREAVLHLYGVDDPEQMKRGKHAMDEDDNNIQFFPGVPETLLKLKKKGYMLGIITDTANPLHVKLKWFKKSGIAHIWDTIISSQEVGIQKPEPGIYAAALKQLGISANQAAFIGHDMDELEGAQQVGLKTIAFNYNESAKADYYIDQFPELLDVPIISIK